jgi:hypothetical protein
LADGHAYLAKLCLTQEFVCLKGNGANTYRRALAPGKVEIWPGTRKLPTEDRQVALTFSLAERVAPPAS